MELKETRQIKGEFTRHPYDGRFRWNKSGLLQHIGSDDTIWTCWTISREDVAADDWYEIPAKPSKPPEPSNLEDKFGSGGVRITCEGCGRKFLVQAQVGLDGTIVDWAAHTWSETRREWRGLDEQGTPPDPQHELWERKRAIEVGWCAYGPNDDSISECEGRTEFAGWEYRRGASLPVVCGDNIRWFCEKCGWNGRTGLTSCPECRGLVEERRPDAARMKRG